MEAGNVERRNVSAAMPGVWGCLVHAVDGLCGLVFFCGDERAGSGCADGVIAMRRIRKESVL